MGACALRTGGRSQDPPPSMKPRRFTCANTDTGVPLWASYASERSRGAPRPDDDAQRCAPRGRLWARSDRPMSGADETTVVALADRLWNAEVERTPIEPITDVRPDLTVEDAYAIQAYNVRRRAAAARRVRGLRLAPRRRPGRPGAGSPSGREEPAVAACVRRRGARFRCPVGRHVRR